VQTYLPPGQSGRHVHHQIYLPLGQCCTSKTIFSASASNFRKVPVPLRSLKCSTYFKIQNQRWGFGSVSFYRIRSTVFSDLDPYPTRLSPTN
jgi:hypothetical protein